MCLQATKCIHMCHKLSLTRYLHVLKLFQQCEKERSKCATAVDCYVKEHGVTVQQAKQALSCLVEEHWRNINQEFLSNDKVPAPLLMCVINMLRLMESAYRNVDGYTHSEEIADHIHKLLNECVHID